MTNSSSVLHKVQILRLFLPRKCLRLLFIISAFLVMTLLLTLIKLNNVIISTFNENDTIRTLDRPMKFQSMMFPAMLPVEPDEDYGISAFYNVMTEEERATLMNLTKILCQVLDDSGIQYIMYGGTLLGSWRHHDLIPWDDDLDILVDGKKRSAVFNVLKDFRPNYIVMETGPRFKFFSKNSTQTSKYPWRWPFVDISFYSENATHIWDSAPEYMKLVYPKGMIFPTHKRPLGGLSLSAPRDSYAMLRATYWTVRCRTHHYSHRIEDVIQRPIIVPCEMLKHAYPFVHRTPAASGIVETLKLDDAVIHTVKVDEPVYAVTKPYALILMNEI